MLQVSWWFRPVISEPLCLPVMTLSQACWQREILWTEVKCWIATTGDGPTALTDDQLDLGFSNSPPPPLTSGLQMDHCIRQDFGLKTPPGKYFFPPHDSAQEDRKINHGASALLQPRMSCTTTAKSSTYWYFFSCIVESQIINDHWEFGRKRFLITHLGN